VGLQETVIGRSENEVEDDLGISSRREFTSLDGSIDHHPVLGTDSFHKSVSPSFTECGISLDLGNQPNKGASRNGALHGPYPATERTQ
jgi:hypothetical protein